MYNKDVIRLGNFVHNALYLIKRNGSRFTPAGIAVHVTTVHPVISEEGEGAE